MYVLVTYKNEEDQMKNEFKLIHAFMYVLVTYKNEEDQMKNECARVVKTLNSYILDAQGQPCSWWLGMAKKQTHSSFYGCPCYLQE